MSKFPPVNEKDIRTLWMIVSQLETKPDMLDSEDCPYAPETKKLLSAVLRGRDTNLVPGTGQAHNIFADLDEKGKTVALLEQAESLYSELDRLNQDANREGGKNNITVNERLRIVKDKGNLLEQIANLRELAKQAQDAIEFEEMLGQAIDMLPTESSAKLVAILKDLQARKKEQA